MGRKESFHAALRYAESKSSNTSRASSLSLACARANSLLPAGVIVKSFSALSRINFLTSPEQARRQHLMQHRVPRARPDFIAVTAQLVHELGSANRLLLGMMKPCYNDRKTYSGILSVSDIARR